MARAALWLRVSTEEQETDNQLQALQTEAKRRGFDVVQVYDVSESAYQGAHQKALSDVYSDARVGKFEVLLIWSLDRLSREGPAATLEIVNRLTRQGVDLVSLQEPWLEVNGELRELLLSVVAWVARWESQRRSERTKAGMDRARAEGKQIGRPEGAKDRRRRRRSGYFARYAK